MDPIYECCCGLDIHKDTIVACLRTPAAVGQPAQTIRRFGTMTADILALGDWLAAAGCTHVAMESTGVYWKPLFNLLEDRFQLLLANAYDVKGRPGRKTDVQDCAWLAELLQYGLLRPSFVPQRPQRELRELTRYRTTLVAERAAEASRLQKTLAGANLQLGSVASNVLGKSGRAMLAALLAGETDAAVLAELAEGALRTKLPALRKALTGRVRAHQRFLLGQQLSHIDALEAQIEAVGAEVAARLREAEPLIARLDSIPGVGRRVAEVFVAEAGTNMAQFPSAKHFASWVGLCPGHHESAGKQRSGRTRQGNVHLKTALVEAAQAAARSKGTSLAALYQRLAARRGRKRAVLAVAHRLAVLLYCLTRDGSSYAEREAADAVAAQAAKRERRLVEELRGRGYEVVRKVG
jgi:transposase